MALYPKARARRRRQDETSGEAKAWDVLRQLRGHGFPVRRQHPIEGMIVDFAIPRAKLVIELDGSIHNQIEVIERDSERDKALTEAGWRVLRMKNDEAFDADHLFRTVCEILGVSPHPCPSPYEGEGVSISAATVSSQKQVPLLFKARTESKLIL